MKLLVRKRRNWGKERKGRRLEENLKIQEGYGRKKRKELKISIDNN